jgi:protoporphyrinogen IX oxidase
MLWFKAIHIMFVVFWFAGIFYLPRIFVYHAMATDSISVDRFKVMERKLYRGIMTPSAVVALIAGIVLLIGSWDLYIRAGWMHAKLLLVAVLIGYHIYCGRIVGAFARDENRKSHRFYRWLNEAPILILVGVVLLVVVKPF